MTPTFVHVLAVAAGGAVGSVARFWLTGAFTRRFGERFPWGTLAVNVTGALALGLLAGALLRPHGAGLAHSPVWAGLAVGVVGSYTTVSSFSLQTLALWQVGERGRALANVAASLVLCLAAVTCGYVAGAAMVALP